MAEDIEWDDLFVDDDFSFDFDVSALCGSPPAEEFANSSKDSASTWIGQIESMLMNDDDQEQRTCLESDQRPISDFLLEILVDSPSEGSSAGDLVDAKESDVVLVDSPSDDSVSAEVVAYRESDICDDAENGISEKENSDVSVKKKSDGSNDSGNGSPEKESSDRAEEKDNVEDNDDPVAKKRRRQLRNRDAAVRSRERKKIYLKDLETKSKYLERECTRLGRLLQCFVAENQALRLCLQKGGNAYDASTTKQESAVLFWESLLLGSLLWYLWGIIYQFPQPHLVSLPLETTVERNEHPENVAPRGRGSSISSNTSPVWKCLVKSRRCKASKARMKQPGFTAVLIPA